VKLASSAHRNGQTRSRSPKKNASDPKKTMTDTQQTAVGRCPNHGIVHGDEAIVDFPVQAKCNVQGCGKDLENAGFAELSEVKALVQ